MDISKKSTDVLIVGAGPAGLLAAVELTKRGISCMIIEKETERSPYSKALGIHARTLETLELAGLAELFVEKGCPVTESRIHFGIGPPSKLNFSHLDTDFPYILVLAQYDTEEILENHFEQLGGIVERNCELTNLETYADETICHVSHHGKSIQVLAKYVLACDGAHSTVRETLHVPFVGNKENIIFFLADAKLNQFPLKGSMNAFISNHGLLFLLPFKNNDTRVIVIDFAKQNRSRSNELTLQDMQESIQKIAPGVTITDPSWLSQFGASHRLIPNYRYENIFFIGDAAHIHNPAGGQGMNLGLQDVLNLAWKLEFVIKGYAREEILNTYHEERYPLAEQVIQATSTMMRGVTLTNPAVKRFRRVFGKSATSLSAVNNFIVHRLTGLKFNYRHTRQAEIHYEADLPKSALQAGDRVPNANVFAGKMPFQSLYSFIKKAPFTCILYADYLSEDQLQQAETISQHFQKAFGDRVKTYLILKNGAPDTKKELEIFIDVKREMQEKTGLSDGGMLVLRQDGIVAFHQAEAEMKKSTKKLQFWILARNG